jgi:hypothetical protein
MGIVGSTVERADDGAGALRWRWVRFVDQHALRWRINCHTISGLRGGGAA